VSKPRSAETPWHVDQASTAEAVFEFSAPRLLSPGFSPAPSELYPFVFFSLWVRSNK